MFNNNGSPTLTNLTFISNSHTMEAADWKRKLQLPHLDQRDIQQQFLRQRRGGMWNDYSSPTLTDVTFIGNSANWAAGLETTITAAPP